MCTSCQPGNVKGQKETHHPKDSDAENKIPKELFYYFFCVSGVVFVESGGTEKE